MNNDDKILRPAETEKITGLCDRQLRNMEEQNLFPKRFLLAPGGRAVGHLHSEVMEWMRNRAAVRDGKAA